MRLGLRCTYTWGEQQPLRAAQELLQLLHLILVLINEITVELIKVYYLLLCFRVKGSSCSRSPLQKQPPQGPLPTAAIGPVLWVFASQTLLFE